MSANIDTRQDAKAATTTAAPAGMGSGGRTGTWAYCVGIDPDVERNGVALLEIATRKLTVRLLPFAETVEYIKDLHRRLVVEQGWKPGGGLKVIIEAGWMHKSNWHLQRFDGRQVAAAKGVSQGRNEQTSRLLGEMMGFLGIPYLFRQPLLKCWSGKDRKITKEELEEITGQSLGRLNQEGRDAALLAWNEVGFPMKVSVATMSKARAVRRPWGW